ncbi:hypothetical protein [Prochlorococcus sp. MIT 1307]|uniref:hypothetical protein n=1 Tax=Prochlorococcus sp. MIT 1307 TaxID=3096219 RepID=UPI002A750F11|nr:hypothetical protein [Prochlorococcus sp. MIT 1307]
MDLQKLNFKFHAPSAGIGLLILALTQLPFSINQSLKLVCIATTWADYAVFWNWQDIPLDARVRYCHGGEISPASIKGDTFKTK